MDVRGRILGIVSAVSLLLFFGTLVAWVWSRYESPEWAAGRGRKMEVTCGWTVGTFEVEYWTREGGDEGEPKGWRYSFQRYEVMRNRRMGAWPPVVVSRDTSWIGITRYGVYVAMWLPGLMFLLLPVWWMVRRVERRDGAKHGCRNCSYDLTGNTSGVCPECGLAVGSVYQSTNARKRRSVPDR